MSDAGIGLVLDHTLLTDGPNPLSKPDRNRVEGTTNESKPIEEALPQSDNAKGTTKEQKEEKAKAHFSHSKQGRLIAIIIILVVSWLIVKIWSDVFDLFMKKVVKTDANRLVANACIALIFTVLIIWLLIALNLDTWLSC